MDGNLNVIQYERLGEYSSNALKYRFGSWNKAKEKAGLETHTISTEVEDGEVLEDLREAAEQVNGTLSAIQYSELGSFSVRIAQNRFGSWNKAKKEAGLEANHSTEKIDEEELLEDLERVAEQVDGAVSSTDYQKHGKHSLQSLTRRFGNWSSALNEAGIQGQMRSDLDTKIPENVLNEIVDQLSDFNGWYEIQKVVDELPYVNHQSQLNKVINQLQDFDTDLRVEKSKTKGGNGSRVFIQQPLETRYSQYLEQIPDVAEDVFQQCISYGKSPKSAVAAINYLIDDDLTQKEAADDADCVITSVRKTRDFILEEGLDEQLLKGENQ